MALTFLSSFLRSFPLWPPHQCQALWSPGEGLLYYIEESSVIRPVGEVVVIFFKSVFIYSHVSLSPHSVSSSLSLSGDGISECHTEFCIHQHHETVVFFWVDLDRVKGPVLEPFLNTLPLLCDNSLPTPTPPHPLRKTYKIKKKTKALHLETGVLLIIMHITFTLMDLARGVLEPSPPTYQTSS